jgi:hypothetical protein
MVLKSNGPPRVRTCRERRGHNPGWEVERHLVRVMALENDGHGVQSNSDGVRE